MKHATLLLLAGLALTVGGGANAATGLPVGSVACLSLKDAQDYAQYQRTAPDFAKDLMARADCYVIQEPAEAVQQGRPEGGFQAYKLLSGHKVWLPIAR
ncbi:MAG: hypothetical protein INF43_00300 [Alphaproteobacteria bacterium]|nr:hypothetical protein [Alphaproteobacteria bacterium]